MMAGLDDYFNVIEASRRLKVHPETVKRLCRQGDLPAVKLHDRPGYPGQLRRHLQSPARGEEETA
jgi:hypothetical protein